MLISNYNAIYIWNGPLVDDIAHLELKMTFLKSINLKINSYILQIAGVIFYFISTISFSGHKITILQIIKTVDEIK